MLALVGVDGGAIMSFVSNSMGRPGFDGHVVTARFGGTETSRTFILVPRRLAWKCIYQRVWLRGSTEVLREKYPRPVGIRSPRIPAHLRLRQPRRSRLNDDRVPQSVCRGWCRRFQPKEKRVTKTPMEAERRG